MGVLKSIVPTVDHKAIGYPVSAIIFIDAKPGYIEKAADLLKQMPNILMVYEILGKCNFIVKGVFKDENDLSEFIEKLHKSGFITRTKTSIVIKSWEKFHLSI